MNTLGASDTSDLFGTLANATRPIPGENSAKSQLLIATYEMKWEDFFDTVLNHFRENFDAGSVWYDNFHGRIERQVDFGGQEYLLSINYCAKVDVRTGWKREYGYSGYRNTCTCYGFDFTLIGLYGPDGEEQKLVIDGFDRHSPKMMDEINRALGN